MIQEILNRSFVLEQLEDIRQHMESQAAPTRRSLEEVPEGAESLAPEDFAAAAAMARQALDDEAKASSGQQEPPPAPTGRSLESVAMPSIDERSFFSRDPVVSVFQSVLEEYFETREPALIASGTPAADQPAATGRVLEEGPEAVAAVPPVTGRKLLRRERVFEKFSITDPGWVSQLFAQALARLRGRHDFNPRPATPRPLEDRTRLLIVGDWGSGIERAQKVADQMRRSIEAGKREGVEQTVVHLGDVYYAGRAREVDNRFLRFWPVREGEADDIASYSANGNHDMYSGGHGYFEALLGDARFKAQEKSSFFSLGNAKWRILGLDTGYKEKGLQEPQPEWIREQARQASRAGQKLCFLSHHQLFTVYEGQDDQIAATLDAIGSPHVDAWFWGHEHRLMGFKPHKNVQNSLCVGHGGVPVYMKHGEDDPIPAPGKWEYRDFILDKNRIERWAYMGFAIVDLDGSTMRVRYINENGEEHRKETLKF
jgi:Calcineurin-like phosphoesterase